MKTLINRLGIAAMVLGLLLALASKAQAQVSFGPPTSFAVGTSPQSVAAGDLNKDGVLDLVVANKGSNNVSLLIGTGSGSFGPANNFSVGTDPRAVSTGDFNMDGNLDVIVMEGVNLLSVLLGTGTGSFDPAVSSLVSADARDMAIGDLNQDGRLDVVFTRPGTTDFVVCLGTDTAATGLCTSTFGFTIGPSEGVTLGDVNNDGHLEAIIATGNISVFCFDFTGPIISGCPPGAGTPMGVAGFIGIGDFNQDGKLDVAVTTSNNSVSVLLGTGTGTFTLSQDIAVGLSPKRIAVGDLNGDGKLDLAVANAGSNTVSILLGNGTGSFGGSSNFAVGTTPEAMAIVDLNRDGKLDLAVANFGSDNVSILLNTTTFSPAGAFGPATNFNMGDGTESVAIGDLNGDGKLDLAVANRNTENVSIRLGDGTGSFGAVTNFALPVGADSRSVAIGDLNGDGKLDLAVANWGTNNVSILLGTGTGSFGAATNFAAGTAPFSVAIGDLNRDGKLDLAVANEISDNVSVLLGDGTGSFGAATNFTVGDRPFSVVIGDLDRDGKLDLAVPNGNSDNVSVLLGDGTGSFGTATNFGVGNVPYIAAIGDLNGDGKPDLAVANRFSDNVSVLLGDGTGSFGTATNFPAGDGPVFVLIGDLNRDGKLDLAVVNDLSNNVSVLLGDGTGSFGTATNFPVGTTPEYMAIGDLNRDGKLDLAVANANRVIPGGNNVSILLNISSTPEVCNGIDDDGDLQIDEGFPPGNTSCGADIQVPVNGVTATFSSVNLSGTTSVTTSGTGLLPPSGFRLGSPPIYYEITTTATFTGSVEVCIAYDETQFAHEQSLKLFHREGNAWTNITTSLNTTTNMICGVSTSLSPFMIGEPLPAKPTAIRLSSFTVIPGDGQIVITWATGTEIDNEGFNILRSSLPSGPFAKINPAMIPARAIAPGGATYSFVDSSVENGKTYYYQLVDIDNRGLKIAHNIVSATPIFAGVPPAETDKGKTPTAYSLQKANGGTKTGSSTRGQAFFFQMLEESGNTLEVARLDTQTQKEDKGETASTMPTFKAMSGDGQITLEWSAADPTDRFNVLRSETKEGEYVQINGSAISAPGEAAEGVKYTYTDTSVANGSTYYYKLERISAEGKSTTIGPIPATIHVGLSQPTPEQQVLKGVKRDR